ncbi:hypothetical protein JD844_026345 [Phrynosoma platyrhinos]|uniref:Helicase POLQ-like n=1 Tax=Phrynosoma platyrhinos TaxID=52577 RepID=A0ABQ7SEN8_PHRPL|nr:hypothetical protein JD844_026345 [Phrynosoma platyrhinos]
MFGDYDSFSGNSSLLAEVNELEQKCLQSIDDVLDYNKLDHNTAVKPICGDVRLQNDKNVAQTVSAAHTVKSDKIRNDCDILGIVKQQEDHTLNPVDDNLESLPTSQLLFIKKSDEFLDVPFRTENGREGACCMDDSLDKISNLLYCNETKNCKDTESSVSALSEPSRRKSLKDHLKSTMTGNARTSTLLVSKSKQLKDAIVSEEIGIIEKTSNPSFVDIGPFYGLPTKVKELLLQFRGIEKLYGKVGALSGFGMELGFLVEEYAGSKGRIPSIKRRQKKSLYIATIEKGHSLVNSLIETGRIGDLGLVVVDELHMLGEGSRGAILEMTLAKILYTSSTTQIIGMSATLRNTEDLQQFLKAEYYTDNFRPVELKEFVKIQDSIYEVDSKAENGLTFYRLLEFKYSSNLQRMDPDHLIALVTEVIPKYSCLVFCPTKKNCENVAEMICKHLNRDYKKLKEKEKEDLIKDLRNICNGRLCPVLKRTVPFGIAYHHSGLTSDERKRIEEAYSSGILCLLTCTSTLAAGVNLPARRVILRAPYVAKEFLKKNQYKQMIGRAGRAGIDKAGESILIVQEKDRHLSCGKLLQQTPDRAEQGYPKLTVIIGWIKGSVDLAYCNVLYADLKKGLEGLILESCLHLLYLTIPYDMISQCSPDWMVYFKEYCQLSPVEQHVADIVGVPESFIVKKASGRVIKKELNEFWVYKALLAELTKRLSYCVKAELIPLMEVTGVLEARAKQLYNSGYKTLAHLANADPEMLVRTIEHLSRRQARQIVSSAKMLLAEKAEALQEEVEELLRIPTDIP